MHKSINLVRELNYEPTIDGSGLINIAKSAKFLSVHRSKIEKLIKIKYFGATKARNGGKLISFKKLVQLRDLITDTNFPDNLPLRFREILREMFQPEEVL